MITVCCYFPPTAIICSSTAAEKLFPSWRDLGLTANFFVLFCFVFVIFVSLECVFSL